MRMTGTVRICLFASRKSPLMFGLLGYPVQQLAGAIYS